MVRFEMVNLGLCFTVKIGFQSADSIITNGLKEKFEISGIYTLLVAVIAYFVLLRMLLLDLFSTVPLTIRRIALRLQDVVQVDVRHPVYYIMPYSYLPLNRNHDYSTISKIWNTFKFATSVFFILCPLILMGYTAARSLGAVNMNKEYHYIPPLSSFICVTSDIVTSIIIMLCIIGLLIAFIAKSVVESKGSASNRNICEPLPVGSRILQYD